MVVKTELQNNGVIFTLQGRLDTQTVALLQQEIQAVDFTPLQTATFDMKDTDYISSAGLRALVTVRKKFKTNQQVILLGVNPMVMDTLKSTGTYLFFTVREQQEDESTYIHLSYKELLEKRFTQTPDQVFLVGDEPYTWQDIEQGAQIMAKDLYDMGVRKGSHVAIVGANSVNWVLCFFAVQKLGAIGALVNHNLSLSEMIALADIGDITHICCGQAPAAKDFLAFREQLLNTQEASVFGVYDIGNHVNMKDRFDEYQTIADRFDSKVESDDVAVMIFTSGSTGKPKGVLLSAYNVLNASHAHMKSIRQAKEDKTCLILPLFHIFGLLSGLCTGMLAGSRVVIPADLHTKTVLSTVFEQQCTIMHSVPTMMLALANSSAFCSDQVASLRSTILAGASITEAQIMMLQQKFPHNHFSISYGLSEMAPVTVTEYGDTMAHITQTVGKPVENIELKIRDVQTGKEIPAGSGQSGEIMVRGYNLMTCYYKLDIDSQAVDDEGWLYTGDLGFIDTEGYLHIDGRLKELIIRGGENIIPGEVADVLSQHPAVADVKVMGIPDDFYGEIVVAAAVLKQGCTLSYEQMKAFMKGKLAPFKIPAHFIVYPALPTLPSGKVDGVRLKKELCQRCNKE